MSSITIAVIVSVAMGVAMIAISLAYLKGGYSYKDTIDELPDRDASNQS